MSDEGSGGCGLILAIIIVGTIIMIFLEPRCKEQAERKEAETTARELAQRDAQSRQRKQEDEIRRRADAEQKVKAFADEHLTGLQRAIREVDTELATRQQNLTEWRNAQAGLGRDPDPNDKTIRWKKAIEDLQSMRTRLLAKREDAYLAYVSYKLDPDAGANRSKLEELLGPANAETDKVLADLARLQTSHSGQ